MRVTVLWPASVLIVKYLTNISLPRQPWRGDKEGTDGVVSKLCSVLDRHLYLAIHFLAFWPVLVTQDLPLLRGVLQHHYHCHLLLPHSLPERGKFVRKRKRSSVEGF